MAIMSSKSESLNSVLKTKDNIGNLIDEIEALSKYYLKFVCDILSH